MMKVLSLYAHPPRTTSSVVDVPTRVQAALDAFELSGSAVVVVDRNGDVLWLNRLAESMLDHEVYLVGGRIVSADPKVTARLDRALELLSRSDCASLPPFPIPLPRKERRPILAYASRLPGAVVDEFALSHAMVVLVQPDASMTLVEADLVAAYNLTHSEVRLANLLVGGNSLRRSAAIISISYENARKKLKSILYKTMTNRQTQLVALLCGLAARRPCQIKPSPEHLPFTHRPDDELDEG